jgi:DNA-binding NarL/FixJ family response regulator
MQLPQKTINELERFSNVVVAAMSSPHRDGLVEQLHERGVNILGPVDTAAQALALIAHHPAEFAIIDKVLAGRRGGNELADALKSQWGVPSVLVSGAD